MYNDDILLLLLLQNKRYEIIENILIDIDLNWAGWWHRCFQPSCFI